MFLQSKDLSNQDKRIPSTTLLWEAENCRASEFLHSLAERVVEGAVLFAWHYCFWYIS